MILILLILLLVQLILFVVKVAAATPWGWGAVLTPGLFAAAFVVFYAASGLIAKHTPVKKPIRSWVDEEDEEEDS